MTIANVSAIAVVPGGAVARHGDALSFVAPGRPPRRLAEGVTAWCVAPVEGAIVFATGDAGVVRRVSLAGDLGRTWPPVAAEICAIAAHAGGAIAVGTLDERALLGAEDGTWARRVAMPPVPVGMEGLWMAQTIGVGFFADGSWVAIAGTGRVHVLGPDGAESTFEAEILAWDESVEVVALAGDRVLLASERACVIASRTAVIASWRGLVGYSGDRLAFFDDDVITLLSPTGDEIATVLKPKGTRAIARDGATLVIAGADGSLTWRAGDDAIIDAVQAATRAVTSVRIDGDRVTTVTRDRIRVEPRSALRRLSAPTIETPTRSFDLDRVAYKAVWAGDGRSFAVRGDAFSVHAADDGRALARFDGQSPRAIFSDHGDWVAYFSDRIDVYDGESYALVAHATVCTDWLAVDRLLPTGLLLVSPAEVVLVEGASIRRFDRDTLARWPRVAPARIERPVVVTCERGVVRFHDAKTHARVGDELIAFASDAFVRFVRDDRVLVFSTSAASVDPTMLLGDPARGRLVADLSVNLEGSRHWDGPLVLGDRVITASPTQAPWSFHLDDGRPVSRLGSISAELRTLAVSPDGRELLVLEENGRVGVFV